MAEISQVEDAGGNSHSQQEIQKESSSTPSSSADSSQWTELMGKDIQMKELSYGVPEGETKKECRPQDAAVIDVVGRLAPTIDDEGGPIFYEAKDCLIVIGDKYVTPALEMGVRFMHEHQSACIWSHSKFAYGMTARKNGEYVMPPDSNVMYTVTVKKVYVVEDGNNDPDAFQIQLALSKKIIANDIFQNDLYTGNTNNINSQQRAIRLYNKAADEMLHLLQTHMKLRQAENNNYDESAHKEKISQATDIMLDCLNNVTVVYLKSKKFHEAKDAAVKVLSHDPSNYKALLRAARAAMLDPAGTYEESDAAIAAAEKIASEKKLDDKDVRKLRKELKQKTQQYKQRQKEMMARMTKDLKPKLTTAKPQEAKSDHDQDQQQTEETSEEVASPFWKKYLPYIIQVIFPFVLYYAVVLTSKQKQGIIQQPPDQPTSPFEGEL